MTAQFAVSELQKCVTGGIGGHGCFGDTNEAVKAVHAAWKAVSGGRNSVLNNPAQIWGGKESLFNHPAQIWGGPNSVFNHPGEAIFGGYNSEANKFLREPLGGESGAVKQFLNKPLGGDTSFFHCPRGC